MNNLSLHVKLRALAEAGLAEIRPDPHGYACLSGEGAYYVGGERLRVRGSVTGELPDGSYTTDTVDIAYTAESLKIIAMAQPAEEKFEPNPNRRTASNK